MARTLCGFKDTPQAPARGLLVGIGPTLLVKIGFDPDYDPAKPGIPKLPDPPFPALVDTGATESCIDSGLAMRLNLPIVDRRKISGVHGASAGWGSLLAGTATIP